MPCTSAIHCEAAHTQILRCPLNVGPRRPELKPCPPECEVAIWMQKYRVYTDGKTHAECIVEKCEAKVCSFKDACDDPKKRCKQGAFCVEHHNQLVDLKVRKLPVAAFVAHTVGFALGKCNGQLSATLSPTGLPVQSGGCRELSAVHVCIPLEQFTMWCKLACVQASGGTKKLSQFPTRVVCPHCLEGVTFEEAQMYRHFYIVSQMKWLALFCLALQPICPDSRLA